MVLTTYANDVVPLLEVIIYMLPLTRFWMLHYALPESVCIGKVVLYLSCSWVILPPCHHCIWFCINMFVHILSIFTVIWFHTLYGWFQRILCMRVLLNTTKRMKKEPILRCTFIHQYLEYKKIIPLNPSPI